MAIELREADEALADLPGVEAIVESILARVRGQIALHHGATTLDIGAAQGLTSIALSRAGFRALGVEPWPEAVATAAEVAAEAGVSIEVVEGRGEDLPYDDASIDLVLAQSVLEHVKDPSKVFSEVARVLRRGGGFYFYSTNAICPVQHEIRRFPLFPWYPDSVRRRIMWWAVEKHPALVHGTELPALHWYTRRRYAQLAEEAGFARFVDRWSLRRSDEPQATLPRRLERLAATTPALQFVGEFFTSSIPGMAIR